MVSIPSGICMWSHTPLRKRDCGWGLGNGSALVSEFCREPLNIIEVCDQNTWKRIIWQRPYSKVYAEWCTLPSSICHMLASCLLICSLCCHLCSLFASLFKKPVQGQSYKKIDSETILRRLTYTGGHVGIKDAHACKRKLINKHCKWH